MPVPLGQVLGSVLLLAGLLLLVVACLGALGRLPRNRIAGIKTRATLRSDAAFAVAHRAAAVPLAAGGVVACVGGAVLLAGASGALGWVVVIVAVVGMGVLTGTGGLVGDRAALPVANAAGAEAPPTCAGTCAGCDLVAGCRRD